jgi:hypothetical protein
MSDNKLFNALTTLSQNRTAVEVNKIVNRSNLISAYTILKVKKLIQGNFKGSSVSSIDYVCCITRAEASNHDAVQGSRGVENSQLGLDFFFF